MQTPVIIIRLSKRRWCALASTRERGGFPAYDLTDDTPRYLSESDATAEARRLWGLRDILGNANKWIERSQPDEV